MKKKLMLVAMLQAALFSFGQEDSSAKLEEVIIYSNKFAEKKKNIAQKIDVINAQTIARYNAQNTGDLLINSGNVFVQKSQQGGSSPVIRGFEASRILLVIDGVRMNNAIYRAGHLQNVITIDQQMLERAEVLQGPSSTIFGSDALGGVLHFRTKSPQLSGNEKMLVRGSTLLRYSSANHEKTAHADLSIAGRKFGWLQSYTYSDFDDLKMGKNYPSDYPTFGRRDSLIKTFGYKDSVIANSDNAVQRHSGYKQWDLTNKILFKQNQALQHLLNVQYSGSTDIPRYDRLQDKRNFADNRGTTLRYAEWYYGPQKRLMTSYELSGLGKGFFQEYKVNLSYQDIQESRQQREYRRYDRFDSRVEKVKVGGFNIDTRKLWTAHELIVGLDGQINDVKSRATRTNLNTGSRAKLDTRYPDGKNRVNYLGLFAQHLWKIRSGKWVINDGLRLQSVRLKSNVTDNSFLNLPVTKYEQDHIAVTGNLGLVYNYGPASRVTATLSSGFRSPNLDDLVKIFDFSVARRVYVPNADIKPEYTYNADMSVNHVFDNRINVELTVFYTLFRDAIVSAPFRLNGEDSIIYNGVKSAVYANQNLNKGNSYGGTANVKWDINTQFIFSVAASYTHGRLKKFNGSSVPLDHIPPVFGKASLQYNGKKWGTEIYSLYNGWKKIKDYNPDGEDNQQYATAEGMPSWFTLNWRGSFALTKQIQMQLGVENILDRNYRYFASGFSAAGRNFLLALRTAF